MSIYSIYSIHSIYSMYSVYGIHCVQYLANKFLFQKLLLDFPGLHFFTETYFIDEIFFRVFYRPTMSCSRKRCSGWVARSLSRNSWKETLRCTNFSTTAGCCGYFDWQKIAIFLWLSWRTCCQHAAPKVDKTCLSFACSSKSTWYVV